MPACGINCSGIRSKGLDPWLDWSCSCHGMNVVHMILRYVPNAGIVELHVVSVVCQYAVVMVYILTNDQGQIVALIIGAFHVIS